MKNKRQKIEERREFTDQLRIFISRKSDERCAWCGKKVYFGYGATVDHFIPLKKGGTNKMKNLVMMCKDCNQAKGSKIVPANIACNYLLPEYFAEVDKLLTEYIHQYDYISRGNLLACDMYEIFIVPEAASTAQERARKKGKKLDFKFQKSRYLLKRAYPDDQERIIDYYTKYLKKYNELDSEEAARQNVKFWMRFGAIYFIEKNNDISVIASTLMNKHGFLSINLFPLYSTKLAYCLGRGIVSCLGDTIMEENDLPYLPISVNMVNSDELCKKIMNMTRCTVVDSRLCCTPFYMYNDAYPINDNEDDKKKLEEGEKRLKAFLDRFYDIDSKVRGYLFENGIEDYGWMDQEILGRDFFEPTGADAKKTKQILN